MRQVAEKLGAERVKPGGSYQPYWLVDDRSPLQRLGFAGRLDFGSTLKFNSSWEWIMVAMGIIAEDRGCTVVEALIHIAGRRCNSPADAFENLYEYLIVAPITEKQTHE